MTRSGSGKSGRTTCAVKKSRAATCWPKKRRRPPIWLCGASSPNHSVPRSLAARCRAPAQRRVFTLGAPLPSGFRSLHVLGLALRFRRRAYRGLFHVIVLQELLGPFAIAAG